MSKTKRWLGAYFVFFFFFFFFIFSFFLSGVVGVVAQDCVLLVLLKIEELGPTASFSVFGSMTKAIVPPFLKPSDVAMNFTKEPAGKRLVDIEPPPKLMSISGP